MKASGCVVVVTGWRGWANPGVAGERGGGFGRSSTRECGGGGKGKGVYGGYGHS